MMTRNFEWEKIINYIDEEIHKAKPYRDEDSGGLERIREKVIYIKKILTEFFTVNTQSKVFFNHVFEDVYFIIHVDKGVQEHDMATSTCFEKVLSSRTNDAIKKLDILTGEIEIDIRRFSDGN